MSLVTNIVRFDLGPILLDTYFAAFFEIYKSYALLHLFKLMIFVNIVLTIFSTNSGSQFAKIGQICPIDGNVMAITLNP